jgi:hypothetical protein
VSFPEFQSRSSVDETVRVWRIFDEHMGREVVEVPTRGSNE